MTKGGWWGTGGPDEGPPDEAYSRVTNPERLRPLHAAMLEILDGLENDYEVERSEGFGLDEELEERLDLARPSVRLRPKDPDAAPIAVAFSTFPGLHLRFGRWCTEPFPDCGCDACDESSEIELERLNEMVVDVTAGRFREAIHRPWISFMGTSWKVAEFLSPIGGHKRATGVDSQRAREMSSGRRRLELDWKPWPRRKNSSDG